MARQLLRGQGCEVTIEELTERHVGLAAPAQLPQFQTDDELDVSEDPVL